MKKRNDKLNSVHSAAILNELHAMLEYSLARYLSYARPWVRRPYLLLEALARRLSAEHHALADEVARLIERRRGTVNSSVFPVEFTNYNDLDLEYLGPKLLEHQRALVRSAERYAIELVGDPEARSLVNRLTGSLRKYVALIEELTHPRSAIDVPAGQRDERSLSPKPAGSKSQRPHTTESQTAA